VFQPLAVIGVVRDLVGESVRLRFVDHASPPAPIAAAR
jgi:hypothetical protein